MFIGVIIIIIGILFLMQAVIPDFDIQFGIIWPIILILIPINELLKRKKIDLFMSIILFIGIWFLLFNLNYIPDNLRDIFWPIVIILVGFSIVFNTVKIKKIQKKSVSKAEANYYGIFSGSEEKVSTNDFKGTNVYAIFGGVDLDLRDVKLKQEEVVINVYSIFGGADILVPEGYNIVVNSSAIFGGNDNKSKNTYDDKNKTIYINCISAFGGTEIK